MDARTAYRRADASGRCHPVHLVVLLYEQAVQDLQRAMVAMREGDIERRTNELDHALLVIGQLQATLDLVRGGEVARNLDRFYGVVSASLMEAQVKGSSTILERQIGNLLSLREAWLELEKTHTSEEAPTILDATADAAGTARADWSA